MTQTTPARPMDGARLLLWTGLLTGLVEGAILTFRRFVQHQWVRGPVRSRGPGATPAPPPDPSYARTAGFGLRYRAGGGG